MKKVLFPLLLLFFINSCKVKDVSPNNYAKVDAFTFDLLSSFYEEHKFENSTYNTEYHLFEPSKETLDKCLFDNSGCGELNGIFINLYSDQKFQQDGTYILDNGFKGKNFGTAQLVYSDKSTKSIVEIISGTVEIKGNGTNNFNIKLNARSSDGKTITAEYKGTSTNAKTFKNERKVINVPDFSSSKSFGLGTSGFFKLGNNQIDLRSSFYDDYGFDDGEYNMEFYLFDLSLEEIKKCIELDQECDINGLYIDLYSSKKIPHDGVFKIGASSSSDSYVGISVGNKEYELVSGTLEVSGTSLDKLKLKVNGVTDDGKAFNAEFTGKFLNLEDLEQGSTNSNPNSRKSSFNLKNIKFDNLRKSK